MKPGWDLPFPLNLLAGLLGAALIAAGLFLLARTIALFNTEGQGTLAPFDPTRKLVIRGVYRYVRNPMISGVFAVLLGETLLSGSHGMLLWTLATIAINLIYIPLLEEPGLVKRFGTPYEKYRRHVPRWIPRITRWEGTGVEK